MTSHLWLQITVRYPFGVDVLERKSAISDVVVGQKRQLTESAKQT